MKKKNFSETNAVPAKKNKASPKKAMLIIGIVAGVLGLVSAATVAFLTDRTDPVVNEFGGSVVDCLVVEEFDGETKSDVAVQNTGDTKSYVRAAVIVTWMSEDKSSVTAKVPAEGVDYDIVMADSLWEKGAWTPTVVMNTRLLVSRGNNIQTSGNKEADSARLHIHDEWSSWDGTLSPVADGKAFFTAGDTSAETTEGNFFERMKKKYPNCFLITSVDRFGIIPHWEVWGK